MTTLQTPLQRARDTAAYASSLADQVRDSNEKSGVAVWYTIGELCACVQTLAHQVRQLTDEDAS